MARAERLPPPARLRLLRAAVSSGQCAFAAAGRPEARRGAQGCGDRHDVGLHHRRAAHHAADRDRGRPERRPARAQADIAHRLCRAADTRGALHVFQSDLVVDRGSVARRSGRGDFRRDHAAGDRRPDAWHRQVQRGARCGRDVPGNWRREQRTDRRRHRRSRRLPGCVSRRGGYCVDRSCRAHAADAGNHVARERNAFARSRRTGTIPDAERSLLWG